MSQLICPMDEPVAECGCGETFGRRRWSTLTKIGDQEITADPGDTWMPTGGKLELRNCPVCGSTIAGGEIAHDPT